MTSLSSAKPMRFMAPSSKLGLDYTSSAHAAQILQRQGFVLRIGENGEPTLSVLDTRGKLLNLRLHVTHTHVTLANALVDDAAPPVLAPLRGCPIEKTKFVNTLRKSLPCRAPQPRANVSGEGRTERWPVPLFGKPPLHPGPLRPVVTVPRGSSPDGKRTVKVAPCPGTL